MALARRLTPSVVGQEMSLKEFLKLPEEKPYLELREGTVAQKVSPQERHALLQLGLLEQINRFGRPSKLAIALPELRGVYGDSFLVPDIAVYRWERLQRLPRGEVADVYVGPPDLVVEILSPEQSVKDLDDKCRIYVQHGVQIALSIHPYRRWVRQFRSDCGFTALEGDDRINLDSVLPGFDLTVQKLFDLLRG